MRKADDLVMLSLWDRQSVRLEQLRKADHLGTWISHDLGKDL
jgi:hypothetical protein